MRKRALVPFYVDSKWLTKTSEKLAGSLSVKSHTAKIEFINGREYLVVYGVEK